MWKPWYSEYSCSNIKKIVWWACALLHKMPPTLQYVYVYFGQKKKQSHTHLLCRVWRGNCYIHPSIPPHKSPLTHEVRSPRQLPLQTLHKRCVCDCFFFLPKIYTNVLGRGGAFYVVARKRTIRLFLYLSMNNLKTRAFIWNLGEINILVRSGVTVLVRIIVRLPPTWHITFSFCFHNLQKLAQNWCS